MNKTTFYQDRSISNHIYTNNHYERHMKALRNIYTADSRGPSIRMKKIPKNDSLGMLHLKNLENARKFKERQLSQNVQKENLRLQTKITEIKLRPSDERSTYFNTGQEKYRRAAFTHQEQRKINICNELNVQNKHLSRRLVGQKGKISIKHLEDDYKKNQEHKERLSRLKIVGKNKTVMGGALVYEGGRYRIPGSLYTTKKDIQSRKSGRSVRSSMSKSRRSVNASKCSSRASSRHGSKLSVNKSKHIVGNRGYSSKHFKKDSRLGMSETHSSNMFKTSQVDKLVKKGSPSNKKLQRIKLNKMSNTASAGFEFFDTNPRMQSLHQNELPEAEKI